MKLAPQQNHFWGQILYRILRVPVGQNNQEKLELEKLQHGRNMYPSDVHKNNGRA